MINQLYLIGRRFIVDEDGVRRYGLAASVDFSKFTDAKYSLPDSSKVIPAGTVVSVDPVTKMFIPPVANDTDVLVLAADAYSRPVQGGSVGEVGAFASANLYENFLPDAEPSTGKLPAELREQVQFHFQLQEHPKGFQYPGQVTRTTQPDGSVVETVVPDANP